MIWKLLRQMRNTAPPPRQMRSKSGCRQVLTLLMGLPLFLADEVARPSVSGMVQVGRHSN